MSQYVYSELPGWECEKLVKAGPGGYVVLIDRRKAPEVAGTSRWAVVHMPSQKSQTFPSREKARDAMKILALGRDERWGVLPYEARPGELPGKTGRPGFRTRPSPDEQQTMMAQGGTPQTGGRFSLVLTEEFEDGEIGTWLRELCEAKKTIIVGKGEDAQPIEEPDWMTREKGLRLLLNYREGTPVQRQETTVKDTISPEDIIKRLRKDSKYRAAFKDIFGDMLTEELKDAEVEEIPPDEKG